MKFPLFFAAALLSAQQAGVAPAWDTPTLFGNLVSQSTRLQPLLLQIKPKTWTNPSSDFVALWETASRENQALAAQAQTTSRTPENLASSLRLLEQMHTVQESVAELLPGIGKYQNPALAELIAGTLSEGKAARDAYSHRVLDLASERETQFATADHEAQRCREILSKQPRQNQRTVK